MQPLRDHHAFVAAQLHLQQHQHVQHQHQHQQQQQHHQLMHSPTLQSTTPTNSVFSSHTLPINMQPATLQHMQHQLQQRMSMSPIFQHNQQQQQQQNIPEQSTSAAATAGNVSGGYIGSPLVESSGPASPDLESTTGYSARDRRASKKGTKRPRPTLSCTECVRRKSKCDRVIPCSTCIKRGSPERCKVDDDADRPTQPFAQARELEYVRDRVQKLEQLLCMLAPVQARAIGIESGLGNGDAGSSDGGGNGNGLGNASVSPTAITFGPGGAFAGIGSSLSSLSQQHQQELPGAFGSVGAGQSSSQKRKRNNNVKQRRQEDSDSELDEDEEGEDGREAEKAAFALESIAVAGRPPTMEDVTNLPMTSQARVLESQLRQREMDFLMSMLPDWTLSRSLVDAFFAKVAWQNHIVHVPTFEAQYTAMRELVDQHRASEIDPAWLSLYFMVLACGLFYSPNRPDMPAAHQAEYTHTWVIGAQRALQLADWSGKPQLTCIQSVVLFPIVLMHAGGIKRLASWIAAALRMAQLLDLHKLDDATKESNKNSLNGTHTARRGGATSSMTPVEREIGKRLYFSLTHGEVNFASRWLGLGSNSDSHNHVIPHLLNVDDADLLANPPVPKPIEVATASSFQVIRARTTMQDFHARLTGSDARAHKYEAVLAFDQRTRELLDQLPAYFKYDRSDDPDIKAIVQQRPYIAYQRCVILYGLNNRLLRAHRPFMSRGYQETKFAYSTESCIKAAKVIIAAQRALRDIFDAADRMYNCLLYCFSSAVVLLVDNFHRLAANNPISDTSEIDSQRHEALDVLHMLRRESHTSTIAASGAKVLEGLLNEEGQRRTQIGLPSAGEDFSRNTTPDNDHSSLREVVGRIASVSNPNKALASPTTATSNSATGVLADPQHNSYSAAPAQQPSAMASGANMPFAFSASVGQPSSNTMGGSSMASSIGMPPTQTFIGSALGDSLLGGDDSEDLLRSLGFFEVTGNSLSTVGQGTTDFSTNTFFGSDNTVGQDLGWLDGLGDW